MKVNFCVHFCCFFLCNGCVGDVLVCLAVVFLCNGCVGDVLVCLAVVFFFAMAVLVMFLSA